MQCYINILFSILKHCSLLINQFWQMKLTSIVSGSWSQSCLKQSFMWCKLTWENHLVIQFDSIQKSKSLDSDCSSPTQRTLTVDVKSTKNEKLARMLDFFAWNSFFQTKNLISMNLFCMVQKVLKREILNKIPYFKWNHLITDWVKQQLSKFNVSHFWKLYFEDVRMKW